MKIKIKKSDLIEYHIKNDLINLNINPIIVLEKNKFLVDPFSESVLLYLKLKYKDNFIKDYIIPNDFTLPTVETLFSNESIIKVFSKRDLKILKIFHTTPYRHMNYICYNNNIYKDLPLTKELIYLYIKKNVQL